MTSKPGVQNEEINNDKQPDRVVNYKPTTEDHFVYGAG